MPDEIKGTDAVSASPDADSLFYLLKITERGEIGGRDSDGSVKEFFDIDDIGVIQSTALLQDFNADEFIEIPGQVNDKWVNGDGSWGGLNGLSLLVPEFLLSPPNKTPIIMMPKLEVTWTAGATDRDTELNAALAIKTAYEGLNVAASVGVVSANLFTYTDGNTAVGLTPNVVWGIYGSQIKNLLKSSIPDLTSATQASHIIAVLDAIIAGKSFTFQPGSNFKFVDTSSSNVIEALNKFYGPNTSIQKDVINSPTALKDFSTVESFVETQINRTTNFFGNVFNSPTFWNEYKALTNTSNLTSGVAQNFLLIQEITGQLSTGLSFTGLSDTPTGYDDGKILQSTTTGLAWVDMPAGGGGGGGVDSVDDITDLPDNPTDGQLITVGCDLYIGCNGEWVKVGADAVAPPPEAPACVSNLEEYNQYTEYKDQFLADNSNASFSAGLNNQTNIHDFIHDVCLFADSNLSQERNTVVIDETTYKWGMFAGDQNINIRAQAFSDSNVGSCTFKEWRSNLPNFPKTNAQETIFIDQDASITGYFECTVAPSQPNCNQVALHLQPDTGETIADKSDNQHTVTTVGDVVVDTTAMLFGGGTMNFDVNSELTISSISNDFMSDTKDFTIEMWVQFESNSSIVDLLVHQHPTRNRSNTNLYYRGDRPETIDGYGGPNRWFQFLVNHGQGSASTSNVWLVFMNFESPVEIQADTWYHLALVRSNTSTWNLYVNGQPCRISPRWADGGTYGDTAGSIIEYDGSMGLLANVNSSLAGHMQDIRISKKAVYTASFTPPTNLLANLCPDQPQCSEVVLHLQPTVDGVAIADKSNNNHAITTTNVTVDSSSIFDGQNTMNFVGNGKFLSITHNNLFNFGSNDFTIEMWINFNSQPDTNSVAMSHGDSGTNSADWSWMFYSNGANRFNFYSSLVGETSNWSGSVSIMDSITLNQWYHIAVVKKSGTVSTYLDGILQNQKSHNAPIKNVSQNLIIGRSHWTARAEFNGSLQDIRISKKAVYSSNFTPSNSLLIDPC